MPVNPCWADSSRKVIQLLSGTPKDIAEFDILIVSSAYMFAYHYCDTATKTEIEADVYKERLRKFDATKMRLRSPIEILDRIGFTKYSLPWDIQKRFRTWCQSDIAQAKKNLRVRLKEKGET